MAADTLIESGKTYTILTEMRNCIGTPDGIYASTGAGDTRLPSGANQVSNYSSSSYVHYDVRIAKDATGTTPSRPFNFRIDLAAGKSFSCDVRVSLYEGEYGGPYKPYVDQTLSNRVKAAETAIEQNAEDITLRATKTEVQQVRPAYASSSTAAGTAAKVATIDPAVTGYALYKGATVAVTFSTANTAATPTLNLNSTGAKQIRSYTGAALSEAEYKWAAGATIDLVYDGTYWRMQDGGSVKRVTAAEASIKVNADNINLKVSKNGVISSINQSAESVKIQASKVEIDGTAVFSAISSDVDDAITDKGYQTASQVNSAITSKGYATTTQAQGYASTAKSEAISAAATDATTKANAAEANAKAYTDALEIGGRNLFVSSLASNGYPTDKAVGTQYGITGMSANHEAYQLVPVEEGASYIFQYWVDDSEHQGWVCIQLLDVDGLVVSKPARVYPNADYWTKAFTVPSGATTALISGRHLVAGYEYAKLKFEKGTKPTDWTPAPEDVAADIAAAQATADAAAPKANAVKRTQRIWYRKSASGAPSTPGTASSNWVTKTDDGNDAWTKMHIAITSTHKYIYTCEQYEMANGTVGYTSVLLDNTITVIDGGNVITHTITAEQIDAASINASKTLTVGAMTDAAASTILNSNVVAGGDNLVGNFNYTIVHNAAYDYSTGTLTSLTTTNTANNAVYIQAMTGTTSTSVGTFVRELANLGNASNVGQIIHGTFEKTADFTHIKLKFNGNKSDADVFWNLSSISTGTQLTLSCKLDSISSDGKGNGGVLSGINLRAGNAASQWSLAPQDEIIGGRNLLLRTATLSDTTYWVRSNITSVTENQTDERGGSDAVLITSSATSWYLASSNNNTRVDDINGQYTASVWMRADTETTVQLCCRYLKNDADPYSGNAVRKTVTVTTEWQQFTVAGIMIANQTSNSYSVWVGQSTSVSVYVSHFQLERGNKATDWTPAPEDMATAESLAGTNESLEGAITDIGELSDQLVGTVTEQNKTITDIQTYLNSLRQDLDAEIQSRQQWLNFNSAEGLVIGAAGSTFKTVTTNTSQQFRSGGTVLAETSGMEFVAPVMRSDQILIGNWMWTRRDNGNLSLKWIG